MTQLKPGVYFVRYQDITKFSQDAEKNGWKFGLDEPQKRIYEFLTAIGINDKTVKQLVIPFSLDKRKKQIGFWANEGCFENDVEETMGNWNDWSDKYIEFYQNKKLIL